MNLSLYNLNQVIYGYIWNYLVDQSNFISQDAIFLEDQQRIVDKYLVNNNNYVSFYCDKFKSESLYSEIDIIDSENYNIIQYTAGILKISYHGYRAFERMFICMLKHNNIARVMLNAQSYLSQYGITISTGEILNETNIINNINKIEKASVELKILFNAEYLITQNSNYFIQQVEIAENLLL